MAYRFTKRRQQIAAVFDDVEICHPDKSTEWLIAMTCDVFENDFGHRITNTDVCEALIARGEASKPVDPLTRTERFTGDYAASFVA